MRRFQLPAAVSTCTTATGRTLRDSVALAVTVVEKYKFYYFVTVVENIM